MKRVRRIQPEEFPESIPTIKDHSVLSDGIFDLLIRQPDGNELVVLYSLYRHMVYKQKTDRVWANNEYCRKVLHWGTKKFNRVKDRLEELELIEQIRAKRNEVTGVFGKPYIKVNYTIHTNQTISVAKNKANEDMNKLGIRSSSPVISNPDVSSDIPIALKTINLPGKEKEDVEDVEERPLQKKIVEIKRKNPPPPHIIWQDDKYKRRKDGNYVFHDDEWDNYHRLPEDVLKWHKKKYNWE